MLYMNVKLEKRTDFSGTEYSTQEQEVLNYLWNFAVLSFNRINPNDDDIKVNINKDRVTIKYVNHNNFNWKFTSGTYCNLINKYKLVIDVNKIGKYKELTIHHKSSTKHVNEGILVKDIIDSNDYYYSTFYKVKFKAYDMSNIKRVNEIVFETLLNIVQHEYRVHGTNSLEKVMLDYLNTQEDIKLGNVVCVISNKRELNSEIYFIHGSVHIRSFESMLNRRIKKGRKIKIIAGNNSIEKQIYQLNIKYTGIQFERTKLI